MMASSALREPHWCQDSLILRMRYFSELSEEVVKISFLLFNAPQRNNMSKTGTHLEHLFRKLCFILHTQFINPLTLKTRLLILLSDCDMFPCKLVTRIWWQIKITFLPDFEYSYHLFVGYGYYGENLHVYHFQKFKG